MRNIRALIRKLLNIINPAYRAASATRHQLTLVQNDMERVKASLNAIMYVVKTTSSDSSTIWKSTNLHYSSLLNKKLLLIGNEKYICDLIDFFDGLNFEKRSEIIPSEVYGKENTLYVICDFNKLNYSYINELVLTHGTDYLWIDDIIGILDESETFYTQVYFPNRHIILLGDNSKMTQDILKSNPNMLTHSLLEINDWDVDLNSFIKDNIVYIPKEPLFLIHTQRPEIAQKSMEKAGYVTGKDFYLYDSNNVKWSKMLRETIKCELLENMTCTINIRAYLHSSGVLESCCGRIAEPLGSVFNNSLENIVIGPMARILYLSTVNRTYCFCSDYCKSLERARLNFSDNVNRIKFQLPDLSKYVISAAYIRACNLYCRTCRNEILDDDMGEKNLYIHQTYLNAMPQMGGVEVTTGELLVSKLALEIIELDRSRSIGIITNGTMMNKKNLEYLLEKYDELKIYFSFDAGTKETFEYIRRGANFDTVVENLELVGKYRRTGRISALGVYCVVSRSNFRELDKIIVIGRKAGVDFIEFKRIIERSHMEGDFSESDVFDPRNPDYLEFVNLVKNNSVFTCNDIHFQDLNELLEV